MTVLGVTFDSGGCRLVGVLYQARGRGPRPTALLLHGVPGIEKNHDLAAALRAAGWNALIFHYRGCWGSEGRYRVATVPDDVVAALDHLAGRADVDPSHLAAVGFSLGGFAAVLAAARDDRIRSVVAIGAVADPARLPFDDPARAGEWFTPWLSGVSPDGFAAQWAALGPDLAPLEHVHRVAPRPLLVVHGGRDETVPLEQGEELYARAGEPKRVAVHPEADHAFTWQRPWLIEQVVGFLAAEAEPGGA